MLVIRIATQKDMPDIMRVYAAAREFMAQSGNPNQWGKTYPPAETVADDIDMGRLFVFDDGGIRGAFVFFIGNEPDYDKVLGGSFKTKSPCGIMHRIASDGSVRGFFALAADYCKASAPELRIDTHRDNLVMQHVLEKYGFMAVGTVFLKNGEERIAYEFMGANRKD